MLVFRTKAFARFAKREGIEDASLCEAVRRASAGLIGADLVKQRVARKGHGRSGGFRTLMAFRSENRTVFVMASPRASGTILALTNWLFGARSRLDF